VATGEDGEWAFVAPYLTLMTEDAPQREYSLREVFNGLLCFGLRLNADLVGFPHRRRSKHVLELGELL
jgi:transposase